MKKLARSVKTSNITFEVANGVSYLKSNSLKLMKLISRSKHVLIGVNVFVIGTVAPGLSAAISPGDFAEPYLAENWYGYRSNADVAYTESEGAINFSKLDDASYVWGYFDPVTLGVGEKLRWAGTLTLGRMASDGKLSVGIFNSGLCSESAMITHTYQSGTNVSSMKNYVAGKKVIATVLGDMTGVSGNSEEAYLRTNPSNTSPLSTSAGAQQKTEKFSKGFSSPTQDVAYDFALEILKTVSGVVFFVAYGDAPAQSVEFETTIDTFDVLGIRSPVTAGGDGITLSNFSLSTGAVVPEPLSGGLILGAAALGVVATRRRRLRKGA